jgi:hypothetical protein
MPAGSQIIHITGILEGEIVREIEILRDRLKLPSMDDRPFVCNMIAQRIAALEWVLGLAHTDLN